ncbi:transmembrane protein 56 isoform X6 [Sus scrofa]|uniref:transmembrane protein 56 isoform X6 n=1 Tax=Sus scrofa TaxID=9823 RepID=UPI000A2B4E1A|nr:transmembrane protein 56 isoform X6 [Sus scrofa]XP_020945835.1 transmembrane protein 56 isoform X6 [Sus scrofa]XP_020945836.1 transmembrane protein 56 isoform X6 [Sus scrofa]
MDTSSTLVISIVIIGFFTFQLLFHFVSSWFSAKVSPGFNNLNFKKKIEWNSRVVSTCHSLVVGVVGLYIFWFDEATIADPLWGDPSFVKVNIAVSSSYLISDLFILILYWKVIGDKYYIIHHCTALYAYYFILVVLRSSELPQGFQGLRHQRGPHDRRVLCHADRLHPAPVRLHLLRAGDGSLQEAWGFNPVLLDLVLCRSGCDECHVDGQDFKGVHQSHLPLQTRESQKESAERKA